MADRPPAPVQRSRTRLLGLRGRVPLPLSQQSATALMVRALVFGAVGPGLRIVRRDKTGVAFRAASLGAWCTGPTTGELRVEQTPGDPEMVYSLSVAASVLFGLVPGLLTGLLFVPVLVAFSASHVWLFSTGLGVAAGLAWVGWIVRRNRARFETLGQNLRYLS